MSTSPSCRVVVLISGTGSNLQAIIDAASSGDAATDIVAVGSNRPQAAGLERAQRAGIATFALDHRTFPDRETFDQELAAHIDPYRPDLLVLAGFMRILSPGFVRRYRGRLLNIHPSLLPKYPGLQTHQRAIEAGDTEAGATVHFVTEELDGGPPVIQGRVVILPGDTPDRLAARVLEVEHRIYPRAVRWFASGRLALRDNRATLDGRTLPATGYQEHVRDIEQPTS